MVPSAGAALTPSGVSTRKRTSGPAPPVRESARMSAFVPSPGAIVAAVGPTPIWYGCSPWRKDGGAAEAPQARFGVVERV